MAIINGYTTLQALKALKDITVADTTDDGVINDLITEASRYIDGKTKRKFYPRQETRVFDVPGGRDLWMDDDLLSVISVTNGTGDAIASTEYILLPANYYPKYAIRLTNSTSEYWQPEDGVLYEQVIDISAWWGCHQHFTQRAWLLGSTLNEGAGLNATDLTFTVTSGTLFAAGQVIKIENEIMNVSAVSTNDLTVIVRGDNGSTAATHANATAVYIWQPEPEIELACRLIVKSLYQNRFGNNTSATATITGAGVVLTPEDIPASALKIITPYIKGV